MKYLNYITKPFVATFNFINRNGIFILLVISVILLINILNIAKEDKRIAENTESLVKANEERSLKTRATVEDAFERIRQLNIKLDNQECLLIKHDKNQTITDKDREDCQLEAEQLNPPPAPNKNTKPPEGESPPQPSQQGDNNLFQSIMDFIGSLLGLE